MMTRLFPIEVSGPNGAPLVQLPPVINFIKVSSDGNGRRADVSPLKSDTNLSTDNSPVNRLSGEMRECTGTEVTNKGTEGR